MIDYSTLKNNIVRWDEVKDTEIGDIPAGYLEIPWDVSGRLDIWKIPTCTEYPDGIWFSLNTDGAGATAEPACLSYEKHLLMQIRLYGAPTSDDMDGAMANTVEYQYYGIKVDESVLNVNDYAKMLGGDEEPTDGSIIEG